MPGGWKETLIRSRRCATDTLNQRPPPPLSDLPPITLVALPYLAGLRMPQRSNSWKTASSTFSSLGDNDIATWLIRSGPAMRRRVAELGRVRCSNRNILHWGDQPPCHPCFLRRIGRLGRMMASRKKFHYRGSTAFRVSNFICNVQRRIAADSAKSRTQMQTDSRSSKLQD